MVRVKWVRKNGIFTQLLLLEKPNPEKTIAIIPGFALYTKSMFICIDTICVDMLICVDAFSAF